MNDMTRIRVALTSAELQALDRWRAANAITSRGEATRHLIQLGLKVANQGGSDADLEPASD